MTEGIDPNVVDELWEELEVREEPAPEPDSQPAKPAPPASDPLLLVPHLPLAKVLNLKIKPRPPLFTLRGRPDIEVLRERDYGLIYASRGVGKTWFSLAKGLALAGGGHLAFLQAVAPRRVVYVDGEMPISDMQERVKALLRGMPEEQRMQALLNFTLVNRELVDTLLLPSLTSEAGRDEWSRWLEAIDPALLILDNISSLTSGAVENNEEEWAPIGSWAIQQRRHRAVEWIHHASRGGTARGTSKREDPLDYAWKLSGVESDQGGALVTLTWEKGRGVVDDAKAPRTLQLDTGGPKEKPISVWNEIAQAEAIVREQDQRERNILPIAEAIFRRSPTIGKRDFRTEANEIHKEKYGKGVRKSILDSAYAKYSSGWEEGS